MAIKIVTTQDYDYEPIDEGVYETMITELQERTQFNRFRNEEEIGIQVVFEIQTVGEMNGRKAYRFFTPYLTPNSKLTALCKAVVGRGFTPEELAAIKDADDLAGWMLTKPLQVIIKNRTSAKGKQYYVVSDFVKSSNFDAQLGPTKQEGMKATEAKQEGQAHNAPASTIPAEKAAAIAETPNPAVETIPVAKKPEVDPIMEATKTADEMSDEEIESIFGEDDAPIPAKAEPKLV